MKKLFLLILSLVFCAQAEANVVELQVNPSRPVVGETFQLSFKIRTAQNEGPYISFDKGTADVIGKSNQGVSISTTIINGKFSTVRTLTQVYELVATRAGPLRISAIKVEVGGREYRVPSKTIHVLREAVRAKDFFLQAEPSKTEVFIGEGIDIRYYLYTKVPIVSEEVKVFPKFKKFIKRYHMIKRVRTTTVEYMGEIYKKSLKYSARIYPEQEGRAYIDPLKLRVQYSRSNRNSSFGAFGLRMRELSTRSIQSKKIEIKVLKIPPENVPDDFTGLVGDHDFSFRLNKEKYIVNEVVEARLEVTGPGALENYDAPKLYEHGNLEEFDTKSEFSEVSKKIGKKVFDYTFLARDQLEVLPRTFSVSTFDPILKTFVRKKIKLPALQVQGGIVKAATGGHQNTDASAEKNNESVVKKSIGLVAPSFIDGQNLIKTNLVRLANYIAILVLLSLLVTSVVSFFKINFKKSIPQLLIKDIKSNGINYGRLHGLLSLLPADQGFKSLDSRLDMSNLSEKAKQYFKCKLESCEKGDFADNNTSVETCRFEQKYFTELIKEIEIENS